MLVALHLASIVRKSGMVYKIRKYIDEKQRPNINYRAAVNKTTKYGNVIQVNFLTKKM
jgi:hypothetical protein